MPTRALRSTVGHMLVLGGLALALSSPATADSLTVIPVRDATIYNNGNAAGVSVYLWAGRTGSRGGSTIQRSLILFDLSAIPAGSTINSATLTLSLEASAPGSGSRTHTLHRVLNSWTEGPADTGAGNGANASAGDCTWANRTHPSTPWATPGGDFDPLVSAQVSISMSTSRPAFSGAGMVADVQAWVNDPGRNFGWIMRGVETSNTTARKFASREFPPPLTDRRPTLVVQFTPPVGCVADFNGVGGVNAVDVQDFVKAWFAGCTAAGASPCIKSADINGVGGVTVQDVFDFLAAWFAGC